MNTQTDWIPLYHFNVLYPKHDLFGHLLAYTSMIPIGIICAFITLTLFVRDINVIIFFCGQLANEVLCLLLKKLTRQSRPEQITGVPHSNYTSGMPSQHSQFQAFFTVYCCLFIIYKMKKSFYYKLFLMVVLFGISASVVYSRIYLLYHFWSQCIAGVIIGFISGGLCFAFVYGVLEPYLFEFLLNLKIIKFFGIRNEYGKQQGRLQESYGKKHKNKSR